MTKFRARTCPRCSYFLGFSVTKPIASAKEAAVTSFCLNCSYRLPVRAVLRGIRRATLPLRRARLKLASMMEADQRTNRHANETSGNKERIIPAEDYSRQLRVIGEQLEKRGIDTFNLECTGNAYQVWTRYETPEHQTKASFRFAAGRADKWWGLKRPGDELNRANHARRTVLLYYSPDELLRMEDIAKASRSPRGGVADGHSLSQLLRTVGTMLAQKNHRLLAISWRDAAVCIVVESVQGKREIEVFRPDNLYDIWVRMYLKRENRALSDVPS